MLCWLQTRITEASHQVDPRSRNADNRDDRATPNSEHAFLVFFWIELSLQSGTHFADPIFQQCSKRPSFLTFWSANRALAAVLCTFLSTHSRRRNRDLWATLAKKSTGFRWISRQECFHAWIHALPNCYTSQLLDDGRLAWCCGWHDDVVDMMMWLTWWWGMLTMTIVRSN